MVSRRGLNNGLQILMGLIAKVFKKYADRQRRARRAKQSIDAILRVDLATYGFMARPSHLFARSYTRLPTLHEKSAPGLITAAR